MPYLIVVVVDLHDIETDTVIGSMSTGDGLGTAGLGLGEGSTAGEGLGVGFTPVGGTVNATLIAYCPRMP